MAAYSASDDRQARLLRAMLGNKTATRGTVHHSEPARREIDEQARLRKAVAVAVVPSVALWALIWFALTHLISNWP